MNKLLSAAGLFMGELNTYAATGKKAEWIKEQVLLGKHRWEGENKMDYLHVKYKS